MEYNCCVQARDGVAWSPASAGLHVPAWFVSAASFSSKYPISACVSTLTEDCLQRKHWVWRGFDGKHTEAAKYCGTQAKVTAGTCRIAMFASISHGNLRLGANQFTALTAVQQIGTGCLGLILGFCAISPATTQIFTAAWWSTGSPPSAAPLISGRPITCNSSLFLLPFLGSSAFFGVKVIYSHMQQMDGFSAYRSGLWFMCAMLFSRLCRIIPYRFK